MPSIQITSEKNWKKEIDNLKQKYEKLNDDLKELKAISKKPLVNNNSQKQK